MNKMYTMKRAIELDFYDIIDPSGDFVCKVFLFKPAEKLIGLLNNGYNADLHIVYLNNCYNDRSNPSRLSVAECYQAWKRA